MKRPKRGQAAFGPFSIMMLLLAVPAAAEADEIELKDGTVLEGTYIELPTILDRPLRPQEKEQPIPRLILMIHDDLRRVFVSKRQIAEVRPTASFGNLERFEIPQPFSRSGQAVTQVGPPIEIEPFDAAGRRTFSMVGGPKGRIDIVQGITHIDPRVARLQASRYLWEMRIATASIPEQELEPILRGVIDAKNPDHRLRLAGFYIQGRDYRRARQELEAIRRDFPNLAARVDEHLVALQQAQAREVLGEIKLRGAQAGQHRFAYQLLQGFPQKEISSAILQEVQTLLEDYDTKIRRGQEALKLLDELLAAVPGGPQRAEAESLCRYVAERVSVDTLPRLEAFLSLADDKDLQPGEKLALAITGFLMGSDAAETDLGLALRLGQSRQLVLDYLREEQHLRRQEVLGRLRNVEGVSPRRVAKLIEFLPPPLADTEVQPGSTQHVQAGAEGGRKIDYDILLPPEYLAERRYPVVITLHGGGSTCQMQVDWWSTQAARHGYIVIAPEYVKPQQSQYGFSAEEHAAVLGALTHARQRFQIDSDRVFLSGHSMGAMAAWDIGLAHPHLFAGVIAIAGYPDKYSIHYRQNAAHLPFYVVGGELDGEIPLRIGRELDQWIGRYDDVRYVEYLGRGHEHFREEIHHLFDWMGRRRRTSNPREFACRTMRNTDDQFYWLELGTLPPGIAVPPELFGIKGRKARPMLVEGRVSPGGSIDVRGTGSGNVALRLSPDLVDFDQKVRISVAGQQRHSGVLDPSLEDMLEDVRVHGDRQHFCWRKFTMRGQ